MRRRGWGNDLAMLKSNRKKQNPPSMSSYERLLPVARAEAQTSEARSPKLLLKLPPEGII